MILNGPQHNKIQNQFSKWYAIKIKNQKKTKIQYFNKRKESYKKTWNKTLTSLLNQQIKEEL